VHRLLNRESCTYRGLKATAAQINATAEPASADAIFNDKLQQSDRYKMQ